jgi:hypothetical protein
MTTETDQRDQQAERVAARNQMAAEGGRLPAVPGEGQPVEEQPGQEGNPDPASFAPGEDRPSETRTARGGFVWNGEPEDGINEPERAVSAGPQNVTPEDADELKTS